MTLVFFLIQIAKFDAINEYMVFTLGVVCDCTI